jgi:hypothetical protein
VDFAEKILDLVDSPERRLQMGEYGRARVEDTLAWHHEQPKLLNAYARLAELRRNRRKSVRLVRRFRPGAESGMPAQPLEK